MPAAADTVEKIATGAGGGGPGAGDFRDDGGRGGSPRGRNVLRTGIWIALAPILMMFVAFASAYIVRRGVGNDWQTLDLPGILWLNTALLAASSAMLEKARGCLARGLAAEFNRWWSATTVLGLMFLLGQLVAWRQLSAQGVYLASNPSSSFFYLLTAAHGLHLLGGEVALVYVASRAVRAGAAPARRTAVDAASIYWHFLLGLWVFLFLLLLLWR
jgi:cytochrome c oxidase subunit 3